MGIARTTVAHFVTKIAQSLVGFVGTLYFARVLGADVLGTYFVIVALIFWLNIPINGVGTALAKRISEGENEGEFLSAGAGLMLAILAVISVSMILLKDSVVGYVGLDVVGILIIMIFGNAGVTLAMDVLRGRKKVAESGAVKAFEQFSKVALQAGLVVLAGYEILGLVIGNAAAFFLTVLFSLIWFDVLPRKPKPEYFISLWSYAKYAWLGAMKSRSVGWTDVIILNLFVASSLIGVYEVAWTLASLLLLVSNSIQETVFPEVSDLSTTGGGDRIRQITQETLSFAGVFLIPGFFGVLVMGGDVLGVYGDEFRKGSVVLSILILSRLFSAYQSNLTNIINAVNRPDIGFRINVVSIVTNVTFNLVLIYLFGWYGAAVATTLSAATTMILSLYFTNEIVGGVGIPYAEISKQLVSAVVMAGVLFAVVRALSLESKNEVITAALVFSAALVYSGVLLAISERTRNHFRSITDPLL